MADLLLTHGYFLYEDPKELQIMKPYAPLGILYLCSHLRQKGFDVDVFDTTFSKREALFQHLRTETPSVLGIYANLMTRGNVVEILQGSSRGRLEDHRRRARARRLRAGISRRPVRTSSSSAKANSRWRSCSSRCAAARTSAAEHRRARVSRC